MNCQSCGAEIQGGDKFCSNCGENTVAAEKKKQGMLWYKFITYFFMPFSAFVDVVTGVLLLPNILNDLIDSISNTELRILIEDKFYFLNFDAFKMLNTVYAFVLIAFAVYYIYISFSLVKFKKSAPKHIYIILVLSEIIIFAYYIAMLILMKDIIEFDAEAVTALINKVVTTIGSLVLWLLIYTKYFNKRKHLFVN